MRATFTAAGAAQKSARVAEKALTDFERPYIFIHGVRGVHAYPQDKYRPRISYTVSNNGKLAAKITNVSIRCRPKWRGQMPPLVIQGDHELLQTPILSPDQNRNFVHELSGEKFISRVDTSQPGGVIYEMDNGVVFQVVVSYRGPSGAGHETAQALQFRNRAPKGWVEIDDPAYTYMK